MAGTSQAGALGAVAFEFEDSFADAADNSITTAMLCRDDQIDVTGLQRPMLDRGGKFPRLNESSPQSLGAFGLGTFTTTFDLGAHGSTTAGAITETDLSKLLGHAFGNTDVTQVGSTAVDAGANTVAKVIDAAATTSVGGIMRVGDLADGFAEGQAGVISATDGTDHDLLTELPGIPQTSDNFYAHQLVYPVTTVASGGILTSDGSSTNNTLRFLLYTANGVFVARGCACTGATITGLTSGEVPQIALEWSAVSWGPLGSITFPPSESTDAKPPVPTAAGSFFINSVGTATRVTDSPIAITFNVGQGMAPIMGPGGETNGQNVVGWRRIPAPSTLSVTFEAQAQTATPTYWLTANPTVPRHGLYTLNPVDGSAISFYWPRLIQTNNPLQEVTNDVNTVTVEFLCATAAPLGSDTELMFSAWRMGH